MLATFDIIDYIIFDNQNSTSVHNIPKNKKNVNRNVVLFDPFRNCGLDVGAMK